MNESHPIYQLIVPDVVPGFFLNPEFRQALLAPLIGVAGTGAQTQGKIPDAQLLDLSKRAQLSGNAQEMAFVALHLPLTDDATIRSLAEQAVARDPSLTWIYLPLAYQLRPVWGGSEVADQVRKWDVVLAAWAPTNATPDLLQGDLIRYAHAATGPVHTKLDIGLLAGLADQPAWREAMQQAFAKPSYEYYAVPRFDLERAVLRRQHWDYPATMIYYAQEWPTPDLANISEYANLLEKKLGPQAEAAGRTDDALTQYWAIAHFGERLRRGSHSSQEQETGDAVRGRGYKRLIPLLQKTSKHAESETLEFELARLRNDSEVKMGNSTFSASYNYNWSVLLISLCAPLVMIFLVVTLTCVLYVNLTQRHAGGVRGKLWQLMTVGENYMPLMLFVPCVVLYVTYLPYARNFSHYMTAQGRIDTFDPLLFNSLPSYTIRTGSGQLPLENSFQGYYPAALIAILLSIALSLGIQWWQRRADARCKQASQ